MKQAVVIIHGMGEQIPMQTLNAFVDAVWTTDETMTDPAKPDPETGGTRVDNAHWAKPDSRNMSTELRRVTTESDKRGNRTDFYEFYWAHLMQGNTIDHFKTWIMDLLLRNPIKRVPRRVLHAWVVLWLIAVGVGYLTINGMLPGPKDLPNWRIILQGLVGLVVAAFVSNVLVKRFGDVARYVKALPQNVAKRQEIRAKGVTLMQNLISSGEYERIVVVAHSLGSIVAYDILSQLYAQHSEVPDHADTRAAQQPERHKLEEMIRDAAGLELANGKSSSGNPLNVFHFQDQQAKAFAEARAQGASWIVSDFVTLGAPLTHAEFLMADDNSDLRKRQARRVLPTCPPTLEFDRATKLRHFSYNYTPNRKPQDARTPHHGAFFAYTRWTNLYSDEWLLFSGDIISGPLADAFGAEINGHVIKGIKDIPVLPAMVDGKRHKLHIRPLFTHNHYWNLKKGTWIQTVKLPHHIRKLRQALKLLEK